MLFPCKPLAGCPVTPSFQPLIYFFFIRLHSNPMIVVFESVSSNLSSHVLTSSNMVSSETPSEPLIVLHCSPSSDPYAALYLNQKFSVKNWLYSFNRSSLLGCAVRRRISCHWLGHQGGRVRQSPSCNKIPQYHFYRYKKNLRCMSLVKSSM